jgi:hypothetical protein
MIGFKHLKFSGIAIALSSFILCAGGCDSAFQNTKPTTAALAITPNSITVSASLVTNITFVASGGEQPYAWSVNNTSIGYVVADSSTSALYIAYALMGTNFVVVTDAATNLVSATVVQE